MDIHNYKGRFERTIVRLKESEDISKENKELILNFKNYLLSENVGTASVEVMIESQSAQDWLRHCFETDSIYNSIRYIVLSIGILFIICGFLEPKERRNG